MPIIRSGSFILYGYSLSNPGTLTDGIHSGPPDPGNWHLTNTGGFPTALPCNVIWTGPALLDTSLDGTAIAAGSPPTGFRIQTIATLAAPALHPGYGGLPFGSAGTYDMGGKSGISLVDGGFGIDDAQDDPLLTYIELLDPLQFHVTALAGLVDDVIADQAATPSTATVGPRITGAYDIVGYWWTIPEIDNCGNRQTKHYQLTDVDPGAPWERLDPLDEDAAPTPTIVSVEPDHGPIAGGTAITIRGTGFGDDCSVEFAGTPATSIVTVSEKEITCVAPAHAAGSISVVVVNEDGVSSAGAAYEYELPIVELLAIEPSTGIPAGGTAVVITGRGFKAGATVTFDGTPATSIVIVSTARITCVTPAHALGDVDVVVTNTDTSTDTIEDGYTYESVPPPHAFRYRQPNGSSASRVRTETAAPQISLTLGGASTFKFSAGIEPGGETRVEYSLNGRRLFLGTVTGKLERVDGAERLQVWDVTATDLSHRLSRRKASGSWTATSATTVITALMAAHAPGFTAIVEGGLPAITVKFDGSQDLWSALNEVCKRAGAKMVLDGTTLRVFTDDAGWDPPDDVTEANPDLEWTDPATPVTIEWDYLGIVNWVRVIGAAGLEAVVEDAESIRLYDVTEDTIHDDTLTTLAELIAAGQARLEAAAFPTRVVKYFTRDPKTYIGKTVSVEIDRPAISGDFVIQTVTIDQLDITAQGKNPRFAVTAKPAEATMRSGDQGLDVLLENVVDLAAAARKQPRLTGDVESEPGGRTTIPASTITATQLAGCIPSTLLTTTTTAGTGGAADKLVAFTVDAAGRITGYTTDPVPVIKTDGAQPYTANQPMGAHRITGAQDPVDPQDYATKAYVDAEVAAGGGAGAYYEPLTNGDPTSPELIFDSFGDVIMVHI